MKILDLKVGDRLKDRFGRVYRVTSLRFFQRTDGTKRVMGAEVERIGFGGRMAVGFGAAENLLGFVASGTLAIACAIVVGWRRE